MAIIRRHPLDEDQMQAAAGGAAGGAPAPGGGASSAGAAPRPQQGGAFVNVADYLRANQGQGAAMAGRAVKQATDAANIANLPSAGASNEAMGKYGDIASQTAGLVGTEGGRQEWQRSNYGGPMTRGEAALGSEMMQQEGGAGLAALGKYKGLGDVIRARPTRGGGPVGGPLAPGPAALAPVAAPPPVVAPPPPPPGWNQADIERETAQDRHASSGMHLDPATGQWVPDAGVAGGGGRETQSIGDERWAAQHGMTYEQWKAAGSPASEAAFKKWFAAHPR